MTYRNRWKMIPFLVTNVINYVIVANIVLCIVKHVIDLVSLAKIMAIMQSVL